MADDKKPEEPDDLQSRFPSPPPAPDLPEAPKIDVKLPPRPDKPQPGTFVPGSYNKMALAFTAASSFIMPVVVLTIAGILLDQKFGHKQGWFAIGGVLLGLVVGITALVRVIQKLSD